MSDHEPEMSADEFRIWVLDALTRMSERELARKLRVSTPTVRRWASGRYAAAPLLRPLVRDILLGEDDD